MQSRLAALGVLLCGAMGSIPACAQEISIDEDAYIQGNILFLGYHEVGHLLQDLILNSDQIGDRFSAEEISDDIATWLMLPDQDEPNQDEEIIAAMAGWLDSAADEDAVSQSEHYPDDAERAARIACYLYGANPALYADLGELFRNSIQSANCTEEHQLLRDDLEGWFKDHINAPGGVRRGRISVNFVDADRNNESLREAQEYLAETEILNDIADDISEFIALPRNVKIEARSCGGGAAEFKYNLNTRTITACYEAVSWLMGHASAEIAERKSNPGDIGSGGTRVKSRPPP